MDKAEINARAAMVARELDGIVAPNEVFYLHSIIYAAGCCNEAFVRYQTAVENSDEFANIVNSVHDALTHAAALSRFFWPSGLGGKHSNELRELKSARAKRLRLAFQLRADSPLRNRRLRDALEHFDERLDRYLLSDPVGQIFPGPLVGDSTLADEPTARIFKLVDPDRFCFVLLGEKYSFNLIRDEVAMILQRATHMDKEGGRLSD